MVEQLNDFDHAMNCTRRFDKDRYLSTLLAPEQHHAALFALFAFNAELARIPDLVSEALPGEIRLQWWRDLLDGVEHGDVSANPVANALLKTIEKYSLPRQTLTAMIDAREFDLYNDQMPSLNDLEGYAGETVSSLIQLSCIILNDGNDPGTTANAAGHGGVALCLLEVMKSLPKHTAKKRMFLPKDLCERHGLQTDTVFEGNTTPQLHAVLTELREHLRHHLDRVHSIKGLVPTNCQAAFLPLVFIKPYVAKLETKDFDPLRNIAEVSQIKKQWRLWLARKNVWSKI